MAIDVRIIAATNKDLPQRIREGHFRGDLFYRIGVVPIQMPPLRNRKPDIPFLIESFMERLAKKSAKHITTISREVLGVLVSHSWPGNVRELIDAIEYACVLCPGGTIEAAHLPDSVKRNEVGLGHQLRFPEPEGGRGAVRKII